jgi:hypothetical protein
MSLFVLRFLLLGPLVTWASQPNSALARRESPDELTKLAQVVSSSDGRRVGIWVKGKAASEGVIDLQFLAQYRAPNRSSLCICDAADATPIIYRVDDQAIYYDIVDDSLVYISNARSSCDLSARDGKMLFNLAVGTSNDPSRIQIDLRSFYRIMPEKSEVSKATSGDVRLVQLFKGGVAVNAVIDLNRRCNFKEFEIASVGDARAAIVLQELAVDEDAAEPMPDFPSQERFVGKLRVRQFPEIARAGDMTLMRMASLNYLALAALHNPELQKDYELRIGHPIDWNSTRDRFVRTSRIVREAIASPEQRSLKRRIRGL